MNGSLHILNDIANVKGKLPTKLIELLSSYRQDQQSQLMIIVTEMSTINQFNIVQRTSLYRSVKDCQALKTLNSQAIITSHIHRIKIEQLNDWLRVNRKPLYYLVWWYLIQMSRRKSLASEALDKLAGASAGLDWLINSPNDRSFSSQQRASLALSWFSQITDNLHHMKWLTRKWVERVKQWQLHVLNALTQ